MGDSSDDIEKSDNEQETDKTKDKAKPLQNDSEHKFHIFGDEVNSDSCSAVSSNSGSSSCSSK